MTMLQNRPDVRPTPSVVSETDHRLIDWLAGSIASVFGVAAIYLFFHEAGATVNWFGTTYVVEQLSEGWRYSAAILSTGIFGAWFAWISQRWSALNQQLEVRTTWMSSAAVVALAAAMAFVAFWIF